MRARRLGLAFVASVAWASVIACGRGNSQTPEEDAGTATPTQGGPTCTPGVQIPCACPSGGPNGVQVCAGDGYGFGACVGCSIPDGGVLSFPDGSPTDATIPPPPTQIPDGGAYDPANLVLVHGAPGVPPFRLCWGTQTGTPNTTVVPVPPTPDAPSAQGSLGIAVGSIQSYSPSPGAAFESITLVPFLITNLAAIANDVNYDGGEGVNLTDGGFEENCTALIGKDGTGGRLHVGDYERLPNIPAGTLKNGGTYLIALTGCLPGLGPDGGQDACGFAYDGGMNAELEVLPLDTTTAVPSYTIGVQFVHASSAIEGSSYVAKGETLHEPASSGVIPGFLLPDAGGTWFPMTSSSSNWGYGASVTNAAGGIWPSTASALPVNLDDPAVSFGVVTIGPSTASQPPRIGAYPGREVTGADGGAAWAPGDFLTFPLDTIGTLSDWSATIDPSSSPATFTYGHRYTFVLLGDPRAEPLLMPSFDGGAATPNPNYDGHGLHLVAFPNDFRPPY